MLKIHPVHNAHGPRGNKVARNHPHRGVRHGRVGQALAKRRLNLVAQLAGRLLRAVQRHLVGNADPVGILGHMALGLQLLVHLGPKTVHQHNFDAHALDHGQVLRQVRQLARCHRFARNADHKSLVAKLVDIRRHRAKPGYEGEIEDGGHGWWCGERVGCLPANVPKAGWAPLAE